jgi:tetratricopeptide (TPR) repeat protein
MGKRMGGTEEDAAEARLAFILLRSSTKLDQAGFAAAARISASQVSVYERGERAVPRRVLERAADAAGFPRALLDPLLQTIRSFRRAARRWPQENRAFADAFLAGLLELGLEILELIDLGGAEREPTHARQAPKAEDRVEAEKLWSRLRRYTAAQRLALVEEAEELRTWALAERVAAESLAVAGSSPARALELAELSLRIAELCPGEEWLRARAQGYAWFHVGNARRGTSDLPGAVGALATAKRFWEAGAQGDPGLFKAVVVLALESDVLYEQRHYSAALERIERALEVDTGEVRGKLLLTKAQILEALGDTEASTEVLREAVPCADDEKEPRTALGVQFHFLVNLCEEGRAGEAAAGLPAVRALAERLGQKMDLVRVAWLSGKIAAGCGEAEEAEAAFELARRAFADHEPPLALDHALVSLDLALLLLEQGRTAEVKTLAGQMARVFNGQGVQQEALAALRVFCEAARREAVTVELARRVIRFLHRLRYDPGLRFESAGEGEAPR